jgi:membrane-associated phospholipid phosphatase
VTTIDARRARAARVGAAALLVPALTVVARRRGAPRLVRGLAAAAAPAAFSAGVGRGRIRDAAAWALHMHGYKVVFDLPHARPLAHRRRLHHGLRARIDRLIGAGAPVPVRVQHTLRRGGRGARALDLAAAGLYASWWAEPHVALVWILARHPEQFARAATTLRLTFDLTIPFYVLYPTSPPWWDAEVGGVIGDHLERVTVVVKRRLQGRPAKDGAAAAGGNPWASMPSNHFATAVATAMVLRDVNPVLGRAAWSYALLLGLAILYLGEHYAVDLLAGLALALGVRAGRRAVAATS